MDPEQATMTAKPAEYQPVPTAEINANYPSIATAGQTFVIQDPPHYNINRTDNGPRPSNYLVLAVITLCCCMGWPTIFCSVIAMIYSLQVDFAWEVGHRSGARKASKYAKNWAIAAILTGVAIAAVVIIITAVRWGLYLSAIRAQESTSSNYHHSNY